jgi:hypothetical protein
LLAFRSFPIRDDSGVASISTTIPAVISQPLSLTDFLFYFYFFFLSTEYGMVDSYIEH